MLVSNPIQVALENRRKLGINLPNPLKCRESSPLENGDRLYRGEAVCYFPPNGSGGALEFGLTPDGQIVFYDHLFHDPEVVVWKLNDVYGESLLLDNKTLFLLDADHQPVYRIGGDNCNFSSHDQYELSISPEGKVRLGNDQTIVWSVDLDQQFTECKHIEAGSGDDDDELEKGALVGTVLASASVVTILIFFVVILYQNRKKKVDKHGSNEDPNSQHRDKLEEELKKNKSRSPLLV